MNDVPCYHTILDLRLETALGCCVTMRRGGTRCTVSSGTRTIWSSTGESQHLLTTDQCHHYCCPRYVPKDKPSAQSFDVDGVRVGMAGSNHNRVQLVNVNLDTAGTIMCEVSAIHGHGHYDITVSIVTIVR